MNFSERIQKFNDIFNTTGSLYYSNLLIPDIVDDSYFDSIKPIQKFYTCKKFIRNTTLPLFAVTDLLFSLAEENVPKRPFFSYQKRKEAYRREHKEQVEQELLEKLQEEETRREQKFFENEREIEKTTNQEYEKQFQLEMQDYGNIFNPSQEWLTNKYKEYLNNIKSKWGGIILRTGHSILMEKTMVGENKYTIFIHTENISSFAENFPYKYSITSTENLSKRTKSVKQIKEEYTQQVCALAFIKAACLFNICLDAKEVLISTYTDSVNSSTGNEEQKCLYSVIITRDFMKKINMEKLNSVAALLSIDGRADIRNERDIYFVQPLEWVLNIDESDIPAQEEENCIEEINIDFRKLNVNLSLPSEYEARLKLLEEKFSYMREASIINLIKTQTFTDEFDAEIYVNGLFNFVIVLFLLKENEELLESVNSQSLYNEFEKFFCANKYAMGEIKKIIDYDIISKLKNGDSNVPLNSIAYLALSSMFGNYEENI